MSCRLIVLGFVLLTSACASVNRQPADIATDLAPEKAEQLLSDLEEINSRIFPYKAIGRIGLQDDDGAWSVRAAWMGAAGGRLRVEAMGLAGQSFAKVICDPRQCYFYLLQDSEVSCKNTSRRNLAPLAGINLEVEDLLFLLGGGVFLADHDTAAAYKGDSGDLVLVLRKSFSGIVQIIRLAENPLQVYETEVFNWRGLSYRALIHESSVADGRNMPLDLRISDQSGHHLRISVERFWTDAAVPEHAFSPELPENTGAVSP